MAEKMSTCLANYMLDTGSLRGAFASMEIRLYSSSPATADAAATGLLCTIKNYNGGSPIAATFESAAAAGILAKKASETWSGVNSASGTVATYRVVNNADDDSASSSTFKRIQGTVGVGGADMNVGSAALVSAATFTLNYFTQTLPPS